jgi:SAM-dependent methyltransferase
VTVEDNWGNGGANFTRTIPFDKLKALMSKADVDAAQAAGRIHKCTTGFYLDEPAETRAEANQRAHLEAIQASAQPSAAFDTLRESLRNGIKVVSAPQLFPTPPDLADRVIELADIRAGHTILEPSAGTGTLLDALQRKPLDYIGGLSVVEINPRLAEVLQAKAYTVRCADFLACNGDLGKFDRIIMNPPFTHGEDVKHIEHAHKHLAPGGRLVAICAAGPRQEAALKPICEQWIPLPAGSFHEQGTNVNAAIVVLKAE